jgi:hypothetical protein
MKSLKAQVCGQEYIYVIPASLAVEDVLTFTEVVNDL